MAVTGGIKKAIILAAGIGSPKDEKFIKLMDWNEKE